MVNKNLKATMEVANTDFDLSNITVKGGHSQVLEDLGIKDSDYAKVNGHKIKEDDDCVRCKRCNEEYEVPKLLRESSGFNEVVYRLYLMGKFKQYSCETSPSHEDYTHRVHPNNDTPFTHGDTYTTNLNAKVNTSGQAFMGPNGGKYMLEAHGEITNLETGNILSTQEKEKLMKELNQKL